MSSLINHMIEKLFEYKIEIIRFNKQEYEEWFDWNFTDGTDDPRKWFDLKNKIIYCYICTEKFEYKKRNKNDEIISTYEEYIEPDIRIDNRDRNLTEKLCKITVLEYLDAHGGGIIKWNKQKYNLIGTHDLSLDKNEILSLCTVSEIGLIELITLKINLKSSMLEINHDLIGTIPKNVQNQEDWLRCFTGKRGIKFNSIKKIASLAFYGNISSLNKKNRPEKYPRRFVSPGDGRLINRCNLYLRDNKKEN